MKMNVDIICRGFCLYLTFFGSVGATLTIPCHVTKDASWAQGRHVNCSHRQLTTVPLDLPVHTTTLLLNNNDISKLEQKAFSNLTELRHLDLCENKIQSNQIAPDTFSAQGSLQYLDVSRNSLCISNACFPQRLYRPLRSLKVLKVTQNKMSDETGVTEYPFQSLSVLQALTELHISSIRHVDIPSDIARFKNLQILDLRRGDMINITAATFRALRDTNINTLSLRNSKLRQVELGSFSNLPNLRNLNMACNGHIGYKTLIRAVWATENSGIDSLVMDDVERGGQANVLNFMDVCDTPFAKRLRRLSVRQNNIIAIDVKYFGKCLPNVRWLNFGFNNIVFFMTHGIKGAEVLRSFPPQLIGVDISYYGGLPDDFITTYSKVDDVAFDDIFRRPMSIIFNNRTTEQKTNATSAHREDAIYIMPSARYVFADHVSLSSTGYDSDPLTFYPENNVVYINVSNSKAIKSLSGPLKGLGQLQTLDMSYGILQHISADAFIYLESLRLLNLSDNKLGDIVVNQNQTQTTAVYGRVFNHLTSLEELDLSKNSFRTINQNAFVNLTKNRVLKLNDNLFKWQLSLNLSRLTSLQSLNLSRNQMASVSKDLRDTLDELSERVNFSLDISGNPLSCNACASLGFLRWLRTTNVRVVARDTLTCAENHELRVVSVSLADMEASCATATPGVSLLIVFTVAGGVGFCSLTLLLFLYVNRWRMRWYYYSIKRHWWHGGPSRDDRGQYRHDVCVVYANADLDWVAHELIDQVETDWALSMFVYERDSLAGFPIAENIVQSLETSRNVLFVLTPNFCDDHWCDFALNMALQRDQKSLILLYIKPIAHASMNRTLRALLGPRTRCTLIERGDGECAQSLFWQRLHDTLLPTTNSDMLLYRLAPCIYNPVLVSE